MAFQGTFAPKDVQVIISTEGMNHIITGYAEDTGVTIEPGAARYELHVGMAGDTSRIHNANRSRTVTLTLAQTSVSNDILWFLSERDSELRSDGGTFTITVKDGSGRTVLTDENGFIGEDPTVTFGSSMNNQEWSLILPEPAGAIGGNSKIDQGDVSAIESLGGSVQDRWTRDN